MKAINDNTGTPVAKGLNVLLRVAMIFMTLAIFLLVSFGIILTTENSISADILNTLSETNSEIVTWLFVLSVLRKIVRTLLNGDPFIPENISRLRLIWIVIALSEIVRIIIVNITGDGEMVMDIRPATWFLVFVIAALAEVFRHGAELRRDAELTI